MKEDTDKTWMEVHGGFAKDMTLRDEFAGRAMQGMFANPEDIHIAEDETYEEYVAEIGRCAYLMADAMLKAREK
ncbi:hypothetical protein UFOVP1276_23 [uncultured Caudovirales phage]|uniref:Uncharacterized protein n=1 Tax=uncultured Caudovirales phage TaxID=2100421 RepID=A0A6J5RLB8_9CAUD|nr:hypothetical protein UFOVP875_54 [uncultured Caudovirales phage]CAB4195056.1 hypothetical protein UFOVP1276_23 [uncultured Caudovirales phage]CAB4205204.1 hypothetical protein UFOVP1403_43 [uncultured Caudovirales phage]CAB5238091.1 hypothetical protein UFOVP1507_27 [uncultured Caudovirales phage]